MIRETLHRDGRQAGRFLDPCEQNRAEIDLADASRIKAIFRLKLLSSPYKVPCVYGVRVRLRRTAERQTQNIVDGKSRYYYSPILQASCFEHSGAFGASVSW